MIEPVPESKPLSGVNGAELSLATEVAMPSEVTDKSAEGEMSARPSTPTEATAESSKLAPSHTDASPEPHNRAASEQRPLCTSAAPAAELRSATVESEPLLSTRDKPTGVESEHALDKPLAESLTPPPSPTEVPARSGEHLQGPSNNGKELLRSDSVSPPPPAPSDQSISRPAERVGGDPKLLASERVPEPSAASEKKATDQTDNVWQSRSSSGPPRARHPIVPRQRRPQAFFERSFEGPSLVLPAAYLAWNGAIATTSLIDADGDEVFLTITPRILEGLQAAVSNIAAVADESKTDFAAAVREAYASILSDCASGLENLRRIGRDGIPVCIAFLASSVLAAYRMHTDEEAAANAYYTRLDEILGCGLSGGLPVGFDPEEYEGLWIFVAAWLCRTYGKRLVLPTTENPTRRYVSFALAHVPLRTVDIDRLPSFFSWAGYDPGEHIAAARLESDLQEWLERQQTLTGPAVAAFGDLRRTAVLAQVSHELECWDGSLTDVLGRRSATVEVFLQIERNVPTLHFLARRPTAFPQFFNDALHPLEAGADGWYEPFQIEPADGPALRTGFEWRDSSSAPMISVQRSAATSIALVPSEFAGLVSHHGLLRGAKCGALCVDELADAARTYLESITSCCCLPFVGRQFPSGWKLFTGVTPLRRIIPPAGLESLDVLPDAQIIFQGGLRLGRQAAWLSGGSPLIIVAGCQPDETVRIDGSVVTPDEEGRIIAPSRLAAVGPHVIEVGRLRRSIGILEPKISIAVSRRNAVKIPVLTPVALPPGEWSLLGSRPDEFQRVHGTHWQAGIVAQCRFTPVWAVSPDSPQGATVLCLMAQPPPPCGVGRSFKFKAERTFRPWADAIFGTNIRRPTIGCIEQPVAEVRATWTAYCSTAKRIKRLLRGAAS